MKATKFKEEYTERIEKGIKIWASTKELGFPNYEISSFAKIRNVKTRRQLKITPNTDKYLGVCLVGDNTKKAKRVRLHRILAMTFLEKAENEKAITVDHIDRNILNNDLNNLRWATPSEQGYNRGKYTVKSNPIIQYDRQRNFVRRWDSLKEILAANPTYKKSGVSDVLLNYRPTYHNSIWEFDKTDLENEIWRIHPTIVHLSISNKGRIKNSRFGFPARGHLQHGFYRYCTNKKKYRAHVLVAETFFDDYNGQTLYHKNGDTSDNSTDNMGYAEEKKEKEKTKKRKNSEVEEVKKKRKIA